MAANTMNSIIDEIHRELDALIEVINAFEKHDCRPKASVLNDNLLPPLTPRTDLSSTTGQRGEDGSSPVMIRRQILPSAAAKAKPLVPPKPSKKDLTEELNKELITMFSATSINSETDPSTTTTSGTTAVGVGSGGIGSKKEIRVKMSDPRFSNQVRYVKVHLIATYVPMRDSFKGKVTFTTYVVDSRQQQQTGEENWLGSQESFLNKDLSSDPRQPKVTHAKGKVHVLYDDLFFKNLSQLKESLAEYGLRIKCRLEQHYSFNLYDWRSDTHPIDGSDASRAHEEVAVYEKILKYKKTLNPGFDETDTWESDGNFLSSLIN